DYIKKINTPHMVSCGINNNKFKTYTTGRAEYVTENNGVIKVTTNGYSPLRVKCLGESSCDDTIYF
ncbi:MAG: hypothetical protein OQK03_04870, partial [Colwellia sp.]|nr:hypothetical protein [Colwellia sp.]